MKLITAIIDPFRLDDVRQAVADIGVQGISDWVQAVRLRTGEIGVEAV
jgi:hypothetical protein